MFEGARDAFWVVARPEGVSRWVAPHGVSLVAGKGAARYQTPRHSYSPSMNSAENVLADSCSCTHSDFIVKASAL